MPHISYCNVCFEEHVSYFTSCGHLLCNRCHNQNQSKGQNCPVCNTIAQTIPVQVCF